LQYLLVFSATDPNRQQSLIQLIGTLKENRLGSLGTGVCFYFLSSFSLFLFSSLFFEVALCGCVFNLLFGFVFFHTFILLFSVGIYCEIYKGSYHMSNISYLNSPPLPFSFIPHLPI
jgi:CBS domain containing-hemolysin-like protein